MIRLATDNGQPVREDWRLIPDHTLMTMTLPRGDIDGCWFGYRNAIEAVDCMFRALDAAKAGQDAEVEKFTNRAMGCLALTSHFAADVYARAKEIAERTNRRRRAPREREA